MRLIYMPSDPPPPPPKKKPNTPLLVGGGTAAVAGSVATYRFGSTLWQYKWVIVLFFILLAIAGYSLWKSFKGDAPEEEQEDD
jgi:membrane protein implicated in regulation of membrane protease activity